MYDFYCFEFVRCALWPRMWSILMSVPYEPEKKCILLLLDKIVCTYQLYLIDWWCFLIQLCSYWFSACWIHFWEVLMSPTVIVNSPISLWRSCDFCLTHLDALILSPYHQWLLYLLEEFSLYYCIMPWFITGNFSCIKICSVWSNITNLTSFSSC